MKEYPYIGRCTVDGYEGLTIRFTTNKSGVVIKIPEGSTLYEIGEQSNSWNMGVFKRVVNKNLIGGELINMAALDNSKEEGE